MKMLYENNWATWLKFFSANSKKQKFVERNITYYLIDITTEGFKKKNKNYMKYTHSI